MLVCEFSEICFEFIALFIENGEFRVMFFADEFILEI